jgi:hypothetical protein
VGSAARARAPNRLARAGAQAHIGNIGGRFEYERFRIPNTDDARVFSLSVILSLLQLRRGCGEDDTSS